MPRVVRQRRPADQIVGKLRAADPFELIRWLARSQPDPRKALAELVQNSIDAGARRIEISRMRERGVRRCTFSTTARGSSRSCRARRR